MEELNKSFISVSDLAKFNACVLEVLDKEAPIKKKYLRTNEAPFMNRKLKKANDKVKAKEYIFKASNK